MKATLEVTLKPFQVPNFALAETQPTSREEGFSEAPKYPLSDLAPETLEAMCDQFRNEVFKKAGKNRPPQEAHICHECEKAI